MNLAGIWQAAYTAGVVLPKPVATATYWHRALQPRKLIAVNFTRLAARPDAQAALWLRPDKSALGKGVCCVPASSWGWPPSVTCAPLGAIRERPMFSGCRCSLALPARAQTRMCLSCMCIHSAMCRAARDGSTAAAQPRMTMARTIKLFKLPAEPVTPGLRPMEQRDIPQARPAAAALSAHGAARACRALCAVPPRLTPSWAHAPQHAAVCSRCVIIPSFQHPPVLQHGPGTSLARSPYPADPQCGPPCLVFVSCSMRGRLRTGKT